MKRARTSASGSTALLEASAKFFEAALTTGAGAEARRYLEKRGLDARDDRTRSGSAMRPTTARP